MASTHSICRALTETLQDLSISDLMTFQSRLLRHRQDLKLDTSTDSDGDGNPRRLAELFISTVPEDVALFTAVEMLGGIGCPQEADGLVRKMHGPPSSWGTEEHFVDEYKDQLIQGVTDIGPILDILFANGVIKEDCYGKIISCPTPVSRMRMLYECLESVDVEGKDLFYRTLQELDPYVLKNIVPNAVAQGEIVMHQKRTLKDFPRVTLIERQKKISVPLTSHTVIVPVDPWIILEPNVNSMDAEDDPIYSLQSEAGMFECAVSGLRWVCKEKVSFKFQFVSWGEHMERLETMHFIPGGPLQDITVIAGKLDEVHLPHWICTDDNPAILDKFAVLHIDTCGDVVEQASEVLPSHVKLVEPVFSPRGVLMRAGFPVKINCYVLIYKTNYTFLTLHVYLIPRDPALRQKINERALSSGCKLIEKPHPERSLKMRDCFILEANVEKADVEKAKKDKAEICPDQLRLVYESSDVNFFEVFIDNPDSNFQLMLEHQSGPVWNCRIRNDDYRNIADKLTKCVWQLDRVRADLVERLSDEVINQLLDDLLGDGLLNDGERESILLENNTRAEKARRLIDTMKQKGGKSQLEDHCSPSNQRPYSFC